MDRWVQWLGDRVADREELLTSCCAQDNSASVRKNLGNIEDLKHKSTGTNQNNRETNTGENKKN